MADKVRAGKLSSHKGLQHPGDTVTIEGPRYTQAGYTPSDHGNKGGNKKRAS